ncbi:MAG: CRISPR system precrRNA processing endoribonuclease RAMP protein Cas6 [Oscillospiraceae bacterium]|nr:CRISPR system precrRNA processing endoribonuclease RAMP protein Cas6 [Oscillospiraceae bacterium]
MLNQTDFYISCDKLSDVSADISPKLTRYLMRNILPQYAKELRKLPLRPFSAYSMHAESGILFRLSTLNDQAIHLTDVLARKNTIELGETCTAYNIQQVSKKNEMHETELFSSLAGKNFNLNIITPAMYRASGIISNAPVIQSYFYSVICRINMFSGIKIDFREFLSAYKSLIINSYSLSSTTYSLCQSCVPAVTGEMNITFSNDNIRSEKIVKTVLAYAIYSGIGSDTSLGMGGFSAEPVQ